MSVSEAQELGEKAVEGVKSYVSKAIRYLEPRLGTIETRLASAEQRIADLEQKSAAAAKPRVRKTNGEASMPLPLD